eukprot:1559596-Rhodomonas_salina.1
MLLHAADVPARRLLRVQDALGINVRQPQLLLRPPEARVLCGVAVREPAHPQTPPSLLLLSHVPRRLPVHGERPAGVELCPVELDGREARGREHGQAAHVEHDRRGVQVLHRPPVLVQPDLGQPSHAAPRAARPFARTAVLTAQRHRGRRASARVQGREEAEGAEEEDI